MPRRASPHSALSENQCKGRALHQDALRESAYARAYLCHSGPPAGTGTHNSVTMGIDEGVSTDILEGERSSSPAWRVEVTSSRRAWAKLRDAQQRISDRIDELSKAEVSVHEQSH